MFMLSALGRLIASPPEYLVEPSCNFELTEDDLHFVSVFAASQEIITRAPIMDFRITQSEFMVASAQVRSGSERVKKIAKELCLQLENNFILFQKNFELLKKMSYALNGLANEILPSLFLLSSKKNNQYNAFIKDIIKNNHFNDALRKECVKKALAFSNRELLVWFFESGVLKLEDPVETHIPLNIILYAVSSQENKAQNLLNLKILLSLKAQDGKSLLTPEDMNIEIHTTSACGEKYCYTALERALGRTIFDVETATLLRANGANNFGSLSIETKEKFLKWEQEQPEQEKKHRRDEKLKY